MYSILDEILINIYKRVKRGSLNLPKKININQIENVIANIYIITIMKCPANKYSNKISQMYIRNVFIFCVNECCNISLKIFAGGTK